MRPLREEFDPTDANEAAAAALLSRVPALEESTDRRRRVRIGLQGKSLRQSGRFFSPVLVAGILLIAATGTSATVTRLWKRSHFWQPPERTAVEAAPRSASRLAPSETRIAAALAAPEVVEVPAPLQKTESARALPKAPKASQRHSSAATTAVDPASGPGAALMVDAIQARKAGEATRAAALLAEYQHKYPQGAFQEEALALSIESAAARSSESAVRLATEYLRRYPSGRFRGLAERALKNGTR